VHRHDPRLRRRESRFCDLVGQALPLADLERKPPQRNSVEQFVRKSACAIALLDESRRGSAVRPSPS
jgi:hypothetical protein